MARFETTGLDELIADMHRLGAESDQIADDILMAMAAEVAIAWDRAAREAGHILSGDMVHSIGYPRKPKVINDVKTIDIYPQGKDSKGVRNAEKAFILHYGTSKIKGSRFVDRADQLSGPAVQTVAEQLWDKYLESRGF